MSNAGKCENFTIDNMIESIEWPERAMADLRKHNECARGFREYIKPLRNKILAHYDRSTVLSGVPLGAHPEVDAKRFLDALEHMCDAMYHASFGRPRGRMVVAGSGDVLDLKGTMRDGLAFERLLDLSKGEELQRLVRCLEDVDTGGPQS
jgi:hypothetical protein